MSDINYQELTLAFPNDGVVGPCHVFLGWRENGYGLIERGGIRYFVHRYVWERIHGAIPDGLVIDHKCQNRACCNVDHLRLVTPRVNALENSDSPAAKNYKKKHCPQGHEYDVHEKQGKHRRCKTCRDLCKIESNRRYREKHRSPGTRPPSRWMLFKMRCLKPGGDGP